MFSARAEHAFTAGISGTFSMFCASDVLITLLVVQVKLCEYEISVLKPCVCISVLKAKSSTCLQTWFLALVYIYSVIPCQINQISETFKDQIFDFVNFF